MPPFHCPAEELPEAATITTPTEVIVISDANSSREHFFETPLEVDLSDEPLFMENVEEVEVTRPVLGNSPPVGSAPSNPIVVEEVSVVGSASATPIRTSALAIPPHIDRPRRVPRFVRLNQRFEEEALHTNLARRLRVEDDSDTSGSEDISETDSFDARSENEDSDGYLTPVHFDEFDEWFDFNRQGLWKEFGRLKRALRRRRMWSPSRDLASDFRQFAEMVYKNFLHA